MTGRRVLYPSFERKALQGSPQLSADIPFTVNNLTTPSYAIPAHVSAHLSKKNMNNLPWLMPSAPGGRLVMS